MIRIGIVGIGFMGMIHFLAARAVRGGRVTAICSRDAKKRAGDWRGIHGNFGPRGEQMNLGKIKCYAHLEELLADPEIDLVDICNPTDQHAATAKAALAAGKHVLVEKAIALTIREADSMVEAAARARRLLMVAHVLPFFPEFGFAAKAVRGGKWGRLRAGHFKRVISRPDWSADIGDAAKTGGPAVDLHIHDTHFIGLVCGMPQKVFSTGVEENGSVQYLTTQYSYGPEGPAISCSSGAIAQSARPFLHGFELYFEKATLVFESGSVPLTILSADGKSTQPTLSTSSEATAAFTAELQAAIHGVGAGRTPDSLSGTLARDALVLCHKECQSVRSGKVVAIS